MHTLVTGEYRYELATGKECGYMKKIEFQFFRFLKQLAKYLPIN
jgi:hypothetical protein